MSDDKRILHEIQEGCHVITNTAFHKDRTHYTMAVVAGHRFYEQTVCGFGEEPEEALVDLLGKLKCM